MKTGEIISGFPPRQNLQLVLSSGFSASLKTLRDYPASAKQPPLAAATLPWLPAPSIPHARRQRKIIQNRWPLGTQVSLYLDHDAAVYPVAPARMKLQPTGQKPPPQLLGPFLNRASWRRMWRKTLRTRAGGPQAVWGQRAGLSPRGPPVGRSFESAGRKLPESRE